MVGANAVVAWHLLGPHGLRRRVAMVIVGPYAGRFAAEYGFRIVVTIGSTPGRPPRHR